MSELGRLLHLVSNYLIISIIFLHAALPNTHELLEKSTTEVSESEIQAASEVQIYFLVNFLLSTLSCNGGLKLLVLIRKANGSKSLF